MDLSASSFSACLLLIAMIYASVGQAGASGYVAIMGLAGMEPQAIKLSALALNLLVAAIGTAYFWRSGRLSWRAAYPFAILGFPFSLLGGAVHLAPQVYVPVVGIILILSAGLMGRSLLKAATDGGGAVSPPPFLAALLTGAAIGFISGVTGTGGGVFLAPIIIARGWGSARQTATTTAVYNLMNSAAALLGAYRSWDQFPAALPWWLLAVGVGGGLGAMLGSRYLPERVSRGVLALLLLVSGVKLLLD